MRAAGHLLDLAGELDERKIEILRQHAAERRLARAAQPDEGDARRTGAGFAPSGVGSEQFADGDPDAAQRRFVAILQHVPQEEPLGRQRGDVAQKLGEGAMERARDLQQDQDRGVADSVLEIGEMTLGDVRRLRQRLAGHAAARAQRPHPFAERDQERVLAVRFGLVVARRRMLAGGGKPRRQYSA